MKESKDKVKKQFNLKRTVKLMLRVLAHALLVLGFAYGLRHLFSTMRDELSIGLTVVITIYVAATAYFE